MGELAVAFMACQPRPELAWVEPQDAPQLSKDKQDQLALERQEAKAKIAAKKAEQAAGLAKLERIQARLNKKSGSDRRLDNNTKKLSQEDQPPPVQATNNNQQPANPAPVPQKRSAERARGMDMFLSDEVPQVKVVEGRPDFETILSSEVPIVFRAVHEPSEGWGNGQILRDATDEDTRIDCLISRDGRFSNREDGYRNFKRMDDPMFETTEGEAFVVQGRMGIHQFLSRSGLTDDEYDPTICDDEVLYTYGGKLPGDLADHMQLPPINGAADQSLSRQWWCGAPKTQCVSKLHFDCEDGLMLMVSGTKRFDFFPPTDISYIPRYTADTRWARQASFALDINNPDLDRFPDYAKTSRQSVVIHPGDLLFIKSGWWHQVTSEPPAEGGLNVAFTWRWNDKMFTSMDWPVSMQEYIY